jgi:TonB family protein
MPVDVYRKRRQVASVFAIVVSSVSWIISFYACEIKHAALPWCVTLGVVSLIAVVWLFTRKPEIDLSFVRVKMRRPAMFIESCAGSYLAVSLLLCGWISYNMIVPPPPPAVHPQIVDIELTSLTDFADNHSILPGNKDLESLRKRTTSDTADSQGQMNPSSQPVTAKASPQQTPAPPTKAEKSAKRPEAVISTNQSTRFKSLDAPSPSKQSPSEKESLTQPKYIVTAPDNSMLHAPAKTTSPYAVQKRTATVAATQDDDQPLMEEVDPPELVELVNNDGDQSLNVFQPGGHSSGGTGSKSELAAYLKELNRRIKTHWSPPRGQSRRAEVIFRIQKVGTLASVKVLRSSGDAESDEAAIESIAKSAPFKQLPADYPLPFLDVSYTFNYLVDQLSEVTGGQYR